MAGSLCFWEKKSPVEEEWWAPETERDVSLLLVEEFV